MFRHIHNSNILILMHLNELTIIIFITLIWNELMIRVFSWRCVSRSNAYASHKYQINCTSWCIMHKRQNRGLAHKLKFTNTLYESCVIKFNDLWTFTRTTIFMRYACTKRDHSVLFFFFFFFRAIECERSMQLLNVAFCSFRHAFIVNVCTFELIINLYRHVYIVYRNSELIYLLPFHFQEWICWKALELLIVCIFFTNATEWIFVWVN